MGMSTYIVGFRSDSDELYNKHLKVLLACREAGIEELPKETAEYFEQDYHPQDVDELQPLRVSIPVTNINEDMSDVFEILVKDIPVGVYKIRFANSY